MLRGYVPRLRAYTETMAAKRGRPLADISQNQTLNRRREEARERMRRLRHKQRGSDNGRQLFPAENLRPGESIIDLASPQHSHAVELEHSKTSAVSEGFRGQQ